MLPPTQSEVRSKVVHERLQQTAALLLDVAETLPDKIASAAKLIAEALQRSGKVLICGNGGSAADAQHFAAELVGRLKAERQPLPAIALTTDSSVLTALGNDYGFAEVFARQVEALGEPGDVLIVISTSGRSPNVLKALEVAQRKQLNTIALFGKNAFTIRKQCDISIPVPSLDSQRIQEVHTAVLHIICELIEIELGFSGIT